VSGWLSDDVRIDLVKEAGKKIQNCGRYSRNMHLAELGSDIGLRRTLILTTTKYGRRWKIFQVVPFGSLLLSYPASRQL
jgi:hypothetical protein